MSRPNNSKFKKTLSSDNPGFGKLWNLYVWEENKFGQMEWKSLELDETPGRVSAAMKKYFDFENLTYYDESGNEIGD